MSLPTDRRKLAAIMFTDMVGYSALVQRNEALALELLEEHRGIVRGILPHHAGREVKTTGDGFLIEFPSALAAAQCAVAIQQALHERNRPQPAERRVRIRIGIHVGDVVLRDGDIHGDGVNIAARVEPLAQPGGICCSEDVARQVGNKLPHPLASLGPAELKNIRLPVVVHRVVLPWLPAAAVHGMHVPPNRARLGPRAWIPALMVVVALGAAGGWILRSRPGSVPKSGTAGRITSLAVRPLDDYSGDTNNAYLSDGMTEALCAALGTLTGVRVPGRSTVMRYKGGQKSIQEMARELNVDAIVEGSVQRAAQGVLITVRFVDAATDRHLWATNYQRDLSDFFKVQNEVAQAIGAEIQVRLSPQDESRLSQAASVDPAVVEAYLRGRFQLARGTREGFEQALVRFQEALRLDPRFAKAYSGIADAYVLAGGWWAADAEVLSRGLQAATHAVALDPGSAEAQASLGRHYTMGWRWAEAEEAFQGALRLNPRYAKAHEGYGWLKLLTGRSEEGLNLLVRCQELEPGDPVFASAVAWASIHLGDEERAVRYLGKAFALDPNFWLAQGLRGLLFAFQGDHANAGLWLEKAVQSSGRNFEMLGNLAWAYGKAGESAKAQAILDELRSTMEPMPPSRTVISWAYLGQNQADLALQQLQEGVRVHDTGLMFLGFDRRFDPLRQDARFKDVLRQVRLGQ